MKWHIIGSSGYIGQRLIARLSEQTQWTGYSRNKQQNSEILDLADSKTYHNCSIASGDFVVLLAAQSSPDVCQQEYEISYQTNVIGTAAFIRYCIQLGANVLFFSSDVINGGTQTKHFEDAAVSPKGAYASMKYEIEEQFKDCPNFKVFRLSYVLSRRDKFLKYLSQCEKKGETAEVFDALWRNVIYLEDVIDAIIRLSESFETWETSIFNLSGADLLSRKDLAELYKQVVAPKLRCVFTIPAESFFEARPNIIETGSYYLEKLLGKKPCAVKEALKLEF